MIRRRGNNGLNRVTREKEGKAGRQKDCGEVNGEDGIHWLRRSPAGRGPGGLGAQRRVDKQKRPEFRRRRIDGEEDEKNRARSAAVLQLAY